MGRCDDDLGVFKQRLDDKVTVASCSRPGESLEDGRAQLGERPSPQSCISQSAAGVLAEALVHLGLQQGQLGPLIAIALGVFAEKSAVDNERFSQEIFGQLVAADGSRRL